MNTNGKEESTLFKDTFVEEIKAFKKQYSKTIAAMHTFVYSRKYFQRKKGLFSERFRALCFSKVEKKVNKAIQSSGVAGKQLFQSCGDCIKSGGLDNDQCPLFCYWSCLLTSSSLQQRGFPRKKARKKIFHQCKTSLLGMVTFLQQPCLSFSKVNYSVLQRRKIQQKNRLQKLDR